SPAVASAGTTAVTIQVSGESFSRGSVVMWNGQPRTTTMITDRLLKATLQPSDTASPGTAKVYVKSRWGTPSNAVTFTVVSAEGGTVGVPFDVPTTSIAAAVVGSLRQPAAGHQLVQQRRAGGDTHQQRTVRLLGSGAGPRRCNRNARLHAGGCHCHCHCWPDLKLAHHYDQLAADSNRGRQLLSHDRRQRRCAALLHHGDFRLSASGHQLELDRSIERHPQQRGDVHLYG